MGLAVVGGVGEVLDVVGDETVVVGGVGDRGGGKAAVGLDEHGIGNAVLGVVERCLLL